jgi:trk system potassium uptake protein TrkH
MVTVGPPSSRARGASGRGTEAPPLIGGEAASRRHGTTSFRLLLIGVAAILTGLDWLFPLRGFVSYVFAALLTLLAVPWTIALFRADGAPAPGSGALRIVVRAGLFLLLGAFLAAKWLVLSRSSAEPEPFVGASRSYALALFAVFALGMVARSLRLARFLQIISEHPARLMALSFGLSGLLGTLLLSLPFSTQSFRSVSLVDNLFTAFSAVCVTGLAVNNVAETYSLAGQAVLCALIQAGGLGIMVLSAAVVILTGRRLRVKSSAVLAEMVDVSSLHSLRRTVVMIIVYTLLLESAGALLLYTHFVQHADIWLRHGSELAGSGDPRWAAIFHAVSAFCNAGFSNLSAGLVPFRGSPVVMFTVTALIILGGIGFPVLDELAKALFTRLRRRRVPALSLHTRIALLTSALLLGGMAIAYLVLEWRGAMKDLSVLERLMVSIFHSASARTAGFNAVDVGAMSSAMLVLTCAAMFVGACPGSTGGGVKTTTVAVLFSGLRSELFARPPRLLDRAIPQPVVRRAIGVSFLSLVLVFFVLFLLLLLEPHAPLAVAFEVVSAFSTTGLSTGITPELSVPGKLLVVLTMFVGRIGPLTLALALARAARASAVELPEERVMIG